MKSGTHLLCKRISALISSNLNMTLRETANAVGINRRYIQDALRQRYGFSFREFKNQTRLNYITSLLTEEGAHTKIKEIARTIGVTPNALSRFVRSRMGNCPRELRDDKDIIRQKQA
jgi:AraC-like DNA-binding protein